jgi:halocyanin-like protein
MVDERLIEEGVRNYDGEVVHALERDLVWVAVGAGETGLVFDPPVVQIEPRTEIAWEWTGNGGAHNVVAANSHGAFDSGDPVEGGERPRETFYGVMFEQPGTYIYKCQPHAGAGMWGAVVVGNGGTPDPDGTTVRANETTDEDEPKPEYAGARGVADQYLRDNNAREYGEYDGEFTDFTGQEQVTVAVGGGDTGLAFSPLAIVVDPGTKIVWEWTGEGGAHNVVSAGESASEFRSGEVVQSSDETYTQTLSTPGAHLYYCLPHQTVGMHGAIVVEE